MPILILLVPLFAMTADQLPPTLREANAVQQHWLQLKHQNIAAVAAQTLK